MSCECPKVWLGVIPPPCPIHNPSVPTTASDSLTITDEQIQEMQRESAELGKAFSERTKKMHRVGVQYDVQDLRDRIAKLEARVMQLEQAKEQGE